MRRNGISRHGKQRWLCRSCGHTFGWTNQLIKYHQLRIWFERWIVEGYTLRQLAHQSGHSLSTIRRVVRYWLQRPPTLTTVLSSPQYLIFDGTFFERRRGVFAVMDAERFAIVHAEPNTSEGPTDMQRLCDNIKRRGITPKSFMLGIN